MAINNSMEGEDNRINESLISESSVIVQPTRSSKPSGDITKTEFSELISHFSNYKPNFISTPFKGTSLQISRDYKNFIFGSKEGRIAVCNIADKQLILDKDLEEGTIWNIDITTDNNSIYSGGTGGKIKKFSLSSLAHEETLEGHTDEVNAVMISKDDRFLCSCSDDCTVIKWDLSTNTPEILYRHEGRVYALDLSEDNEHVASGGADGIANVYNLSERKTVFSHKIEGGMIWCIRISINNKFLIAGDDRPKISV